MASPLSSPSQHDFRLDGMLAAISTLVTCFGALLLFGGITIPVFVRATSLSVAVHRVAWQCLEAITLGVVLIFGARLARHGRRLGAQLILIAFAMLSATSFVSRGLRGIVPTLVFAVLAFPLLKRWRAFQ
jgi:hypothetical protein